jgi:hypothetical protein
MKHSEEKPAKKLSRKGTAAPTYRYGDGVRDVFLNPQPSYSVSDAEARLEIENLFLPSRSDYRNGRVPLESFLSELMMRWSSQKLDDVLSGEGADDLRHLLPEGRAMRSVTFMLPAYLITALTVESERLSRRPGHQISDPNAALESLLEDYAFDMDAATDEEAEQHAPGFRKARDLSGTLARTLFRRLQEQAIRMFFADPKETYSRDDVDAIFGGTEEELLDELFHDEVTTAARSVVADHLRGRVSPALIGRVVGDIIPEVSLRTRTIALPAWLDDALQACAAKRGGDIADVISEEILNELQGAGIARDLSESLGEIPTYDRLIPTPPQRSTFAKRA